MPVPKELKSVITDVLRTILNDPNGEFGPLRRKAFVASWHSLDIPVATLTYQFLNVLAAEHVMPLYEEYERLGWTNNWYHKELSRRIIQITKAILVHDIPEDVASTITISYHMVIGNIADEMPCNALMALYSSYRALTVCSNYIPLSEFDSLSRIAFVGTFKVNTSTGQAERQQENALRGEQFSDMDWAKSSKSDTAAAAAIAWSCTADSYLPQVDKLKNFWEWWFNTAIPEAWDMIGYEE